MHATGTFDVKVTPAEPSAFEKASGFGRYEYDKTWHGDFEGTSKGEMVTGGEPANGAMAYAAMEKMTGALQGRTGTFSFVHQATMMKGDAASGVMRIVVVPGSGTGELAGLNGELKIVIDATGKHTWTFDYSLP